MDRFPFLSFSCFRSWQLARDEETVRVLAALGKRARFAPGLYIVLCVCVYVCLFIFCFPSTWLPESAVYLGWVWCLHACVCLCLFLCVSLASSHSRQVKSDRHDWLTCFTPNSSIVFISSSPSLFSTHIHFYVLNRNPPAIFFSMCWYTSGFTW